MLYFGLASHFFSPSLLPRSQSIDPMNTLVESQEIKVVRLTASLFFGNNEEMKTEFENLLMAAADEPTGGMEGGSGGLGSLLSPPAHPPKAIVIDASGVSHLDLSGVEAVEHLHKLATEKGVKLAFVQAKGVFRERLRASKLWEKVGGEAYESLSVDEVVTQLVAELGMPPFPPGAGHWGSPKMGGMDQPLLGQQQGGREGGKNVSLHKHHHHHGHHKHEPVLFDLAEGGREGGGRGGGGGGGSAAAAAARQVGGGGGGGGGGGQAQANAKRQQIKSNSKGGRHTRTASGRGIIHNTPVHEGNDEAELSAERAEEGEGGGEGKQVEGGYVYGQYGSV